MPRLCWWMGVWLKEQQFTQQHFSFVLRVLEFLTDYSPLENISKYEDAQKCWCIGRVGQRSKTYTETVHQRIIVKFSFLQNWSMRGLVEKAPLACHPSAFKELSESWWVVSRFYFFDQPYTHQFCVIDALIDCAACVCERIKCCL